MMFKKIKNYLLLKKRMRIEMLETLAAICLYLGTDNRRNKYSNFMYGHFRELKALSEELRKGEWNDVKR